MNLLTCVVTYNRIEYTKRCIGSYLDTVGDDAMLVVVDNGSTDGTRDWLAQLPHVIHAESNLYPGGACNLGWDYGLATFDAALLHRSDNDIEYLPGWRVEVERAIEDFPEVALLGILNLHEDRHIDGPGEPGIEPVPRVGGNVIMPARLFTEGLRWNEGAWRPGSDEDGPMSWAAARHGWVARLNRTVANNMSFCRYDDYPSYYDETARARGFANARGSV
ncbi:MAG TPA: glycosyltransferase [Actinomycetes bacterium]|nr:glycosyltransferase [Actinomycetes bacterium]HUX14887.1 glycosyltransferase [Phycisphaerae bacterium]